MPKLLSVVAMLTLIGALCSSVAYAAELPGTGKTLRIGEGDSMGANYVVTAIAVRAFEELGYETKITTLSSLLAFQAIASGDIDFSPAAAFPQGELAFKSIESDAIRVNKGMIAGGGINGYLIDKKTAEQYGIKSLEQLKDPKIAVLFGKDDKSGKADLINCDPGWNCGNIVDYQIDKFGLTGTVRSVRGKYEPLMAESIARVKRGEPAFFYAWSPSWVNNALVPGKDVVWLPTPFDALPDGVPDKGSALVSNVDGCAGDANPCRMAMPAWNWRAVLNRKFAEENPEVVAILDRLSFPLATWSSWEATLYQKGSDRRKATRLADEWIENNRERYQQLLTHE